MASVVVGGPPKPRLLFTNAAVAHRGVRCDRCCLLVSKALKIQVFLSLQLFSVIVNALQCFFFFLLRQNYTCIGLFRDRQKALKERLNVLSSYQDTQHSNMQQYFSSEVQILGLSNKFKHCNIFESILKYFRTPVLQRFLLVF